MAEIEGIKVIRQEISFKDLNIYLGAPFENMIKFVVDIEREVMAIGGEMHADSEAVLLEDGSKQENLWGANIYPLHDKESRIEFTSLINIRPSADNLSLEIKSEEIRNRIKKIVEKLIRFQYE